MGFCIIEYANLLIYFSQWTYDYSAVHDVFSSSCFMKQKFKIQMYLA